MKKNSSFVIILLVIAATLLLCSLVVSCSPTAQGDDPTDTTATAGETQDTEAKETSVGSGTTEDETVLEEATETSTEIDTTEDQTVSEEDTKEQDTLEEETVLTPDSVIAAISPAHGETVCVANAQVAEYASKYTIGSSLSYHNSGDIYAPLPLTLTWEDVGADCYRVRLSTSADFTDSKVVLTAAETVSFNNPMVGTTYYWQVEALYEDRTDASAIFAFKTANTPRTVYIDGVTNTRDIGGYAVTETTRIRQGMIYRSGYLHEITEEGLYQAREELGIKCELDFRTPGEGGAGVSSSLGEDILYYNFDGVYYLGMKDSQRQKILANEIKVFADPNNYPMIIHCSLGRDRTGTAAMLILALCGVSEEDIICDYELSMFSSLGSRGEPETLVSEQIKPTLDYIKSVGRKDNLQENVEAFLLKIGVTADEIASIKAIMIEEVK